jgi:Ribbon-helix-helix protein, copG family.
MAKTVLNSKRMQTLTVHLPEAYVDAIDVLVAKGFYMNRSEAVRSAVRDLIMREMKHVFARKESADAE